MYRKQKIGLQENADGHKLKRNAPNSPGLDHFQFQDNTILLSF